MPHIPHYFTIPHFKYKFQRLRGHIKWQILITQIVSLSSQLCAVIADTKSIFKHGSFLYHGMTETQTIVEASSNDSELC